MGSWSAVFPATGLAILLKMTYYIYPSQTTGSLWNYDWMTGHQELALASSIEHCAGTKEFAQGTPRKDAGSCWQTDRGTRVGFHLVRLFPFLLSLFFFIPCTLRATRVSPYSFHCIANFACPKVMCTDSPSPTPSLPESHVTAYECKQ